jgi:Lon protease-like protein
MSEASEKVLGIRSLPLFPLSLVLLPHELLPLHIFEPRYRKMVKDAALEKNMFGVLMFEPVESFAETPPIGTIGCVAEIRDVEQLPDGRSNLLTFGIIRFCLLDYIDAGEPYLVGEVEFFEDDAQDEDVLEVLAEDVYTLFDRVARAGHKLRGQPGEMTEVPRVAPEQFSFLVASAFNLEKSFKYGLLETRSTVERLEKLRGILRETVGRMEENAKIHKAAQSNGHSKKKIDF